MAGTRRKPKRKKAQPIFRPGEGRLPAHVYAERFAKRFNLIITSGYRSASENAAAGGSPTSWHVEGVAFDFFPKRYGLWGKLDRARAFIYAKLQGKVVEVLWRVPNHAPGDNPHLHVAFDPADVKPSHRRY